MTETAKALVNRLGAAARAAAALLGAASTEQKNKALLAAARYLTSASSEIIEANTEDMRRAESAGRDDAYLDRLFLNEKRVAAMAAALQQIAELPDPVGRVLHETKRPNGLIIRRVASPLGVIGMVFESRPNVGADAGALCLKSGNAVILRGGSDSLQSSQRIVECLRQGLRDAGLPEASVQLIESTEREVVAALLQCTAYIDLVIPRGGKGLVSLVRDQARVPTLLHLDGNNHTYIHASADIDMAVEVSANAKMRRTGVCGATETIVLDRAIASEVLPRLVDALEGCEVRGDDNARGIDPRIVAASSDDWSTEFLAPIVAVKIVEDVTEAITFVKKHHSGHTDSIIASDQAVADNFMSRIDSAVVMHNASTQFSDGGEFGMGAEIGIATGKLHARGPVGLEQLTTMKYEVRGSGQTRP
ncbi:MAG: glutamate-5-semialdehyde dehydrogenase [Pseudomonadota bacterium]